MTSTQGGTILVIAIVLLIAIDDTTSLFRTKRIKAKRAYRKRK